jgi:hypothetical protein
MPAYDAVRFAPPAPLASVSLRNSITSNVLQDVPMLLDSGADITLVPQGSVIQLGVEISSDNVYELMGFDGSRSLARVVELDLLFLQRKFRGRFLLIDQKCGIIGRDILNHLSLLFDGPNLNWNEPQP